MTLPLLRKSLAAFFVSGLACGLPALAQTANSNSSPASSEETVQLTEFTVSATSLSGYVASESVTGSRVATKIQDLPFQVNVITSEFLNDFDFFEIDSSMAYTSSLTGLDSQGNYNLRGFGATFQLRNGFYRLGLVDRVNIDRIEVIKGPNAAIYGQTSPSGLVNIISKTPRSTSSQRLSLTGGSQDMRRGELNVGGRIGTIGGVSFDHIFSASAMDRDYDVPYAHLKQRAVSEAVLAKRGNSSLLAEVEWSKRDSIAPVATVPYIVTRSGTRYTYTNQIAPQLGRFNQSGPNGEQNREMTTVNLTFEHRFSPTWSTRIAGYWYGREALNFNTSSGNQYDPNLNIITGRNPTLSVLNEDGGAMQADLLAHYWTNNRALEHKTLITFDWASNWRYRHETKPLTSVIGSTDVNVLTPNFTMPSRDRWNIVTRNDHTRNDVMGVYLRQQTAMLNGRLIMFGGVRYDHVTFNLDFGNQYNVGGSSPGSLSKAGTVDHFTDDAVSPSFGANYKLTKNLSLYANYSRSFFPNAQSSKLGDPRLPNERAKGFDYGVKAAFLNDRLVFTLGGYAITRDGVKATVVENGTTVDRAAGVQKADGVEFDFTWRISDSVTLLGGYGYVDARVASLGRDADAVGRRPSGVPVDNGGLALKFDIPAVRGLSFTTGVKYIGRANPDSLATVSGGNPDIARRNFEVPSSTVVDAGISYRWRTAERLSHSVRFSARNVFDREYLTSNLNLGDRRGFFLSYTLSH